MAALTICSAAAGKAQAVRSSAQKPKAVAALPRLATAVGAAAVLLTSTPAFAGDLTLGQQVFDNNCAACHMGGQNSVQPEKTLQKAALEQYLEGGFSVASIITQVENGKGAMPAWSGRLDSDEIESVAEYVFKQAEGNLW
uniref:Cytochrome c-553 n=1 Tax=Chlorella vulgaris TaxID=3077 RepID=Q8GTB2_CHLVU|nr:precursor cytochrome c6 [Chlorella vulgaris]